MVQYDIVVIDELKFPKLKITSDLITIKIPAHIMNRDPIIDFFCDVAERIGPVDKQLTGQLNNSMLLMHTKNRKEAYCFINDFELCC